MPCEQIDASAVAVLVEARFGHDRPIPRFEPTFPGGLERCVALVEQAIELGTTPARLEIELHLSSLEAAPHGRECQVIDMSAFDQGPGRPMDSGAIGRVLLSPSPATTQRAEDTTKVDISHGPMVPKRSLPLPY